MVVLHNFHRPIVALHNLRGPIGALHSYRGPIVASHNFRGPIVASHNFRGPMRRLNYLFSRTLALVVVVVGYSGEGLAYRQTTTRLRRKKGGFKNLN